MNFSQLTPTFGIVLLCSFALAMFLLTWFFGGRIVNRTDSFLLADRKVGMWSGSLSIAASWIWAPALFISSQKSYEQGLPGAFWFIFPNMLALLVFAPFAKRIRDLLPAGYTLSEYVGRESDRKTHLAVLGILFVNQCYCLGIQLRAGASLFQYLTGLNYLTVLVVILSITLLYSLSAGFKASVVTDTVQMAAILGVILVVVPWAISSAGLRTLTDGLGGFENAHRNIFDPEVALFFGVVTTISLISGPITDQQHWQRAFALRRTQITKSYMLASVIFVTVPLSLSLLGFLAAGDSGISDAGLNRQLVGVVATANFLPAWTVAAFALMLLAGLSSTMDSAFAAASSLGSVDIFKKYLRKDVVEYSERSMLKAARVSMLVLLVGGVAFALIPGLDLLTMFLIFTTLRGCLAIPVVALLFGGENINRSTLFWSILFSFLIGFSISTYGKYTGQELLSVVGSVLTIGIGILIIWGGSRLAREKPSS